jgi:hypothetical protein
VVANVLATFFATPEEDGFEAEGSVAWLFRDTERIDWASHDVTLTGHGNSSVLIRHHQ